VGSAELVAGAPGAAHPVPTIADRRPTLPRAQHSVATSPEDDVVVALAIGVLKGFMSVVGGLLLAVTLPLVGGWSSFVVMSDSMSPSILAGNVLVSRPVPDEGPKVGQVIVAIDPDTPGHRLSHRVVTIRPNGEIVTKGDANREVDSTPMPRDNVLGVAVLNVSDVGLPKVWISRGQYGRLAIAGLFMALITAAIVYRSPGWSSGARARIAARRADGAPAGTAPVTLDVLPGLPLQRQASGSEAAGHEPGPRRAADPARR
jgi:signal peptidase